MITIGAYKNPAERMRLEAKHLCSDRVVIGKPAVSMPFN
jgi:hypothetical protein